jgi:uncharacterized protein (UPF0333 family)
MFLHKKAQSMLEYTILISIVVAAILIMQFFVKRHFQGGLKESAEKMGEAFSSSNTTTSQERTMGGDQNIREEVGTTSTTKAVMNQFISTAAPIGTVDKGVYSATVRSGGKSKMTSETRTDAAQYEATTVGGHPNTSYQDFDITGS